MKMLSVSAICLTLIPSLAFSQGTCVKPEIVGAAQIRELDVMLLVGSLRCRVSNPDVTTSYTAFAAQAREIIANATTQLKSYLGSDAAFDKYQIRLANHYGGGAGKPDCSALTSVIQRATQAVNHNVTAQLAADFIPEPEGIDERCSTFAAR